MKRPFLLPFSPLYGLVVGIRNVAFDKGWLPSVKHDLPIIVLGNISVGGTGKTPHTEWILSHLRGQFNIAVLSRGYGRVTKGFHLVETNSTAREVGDEPLQMKRKFPNTTVAVCEDRNAGVEQLKSGGYDAILLDDAFQHRKITPSFSIVLTTYDQPPFRDYYLPGGDLRESIHGLKRADAILVTKCPNKNVSEEDWRNNLQLNSDQSLHFSSFRYGLIKSAKSGISQSTPVKIVAVTGIAHPKPFIEHLQKTCDLFHLDFPDHYAFKDADYKIIAEACSTFGTRTVVTTEKDLQRLDLSHPAIEGISFAVQPIEVEIFSESDSLIEQIRNHIKSFRKAE